MSSTDPHDAVRQPTSPLRIPKRDHAAALARRTSSSYRHVRNSQLVSNSPFKSTIPIPSPRRVSGEKRPRPLSFVEQADTERTFAYKRERRQSKGFQGLIRNEPVTKSPFKRPPEEDPTPMTSTSQFATAYIHSVEPEIPTSEPVTFSTTPEPRPAPSHATASPTRSCLVSRRMHGPRASGSGRDSLGGRRRGGKMVIFHEECDVVEFEPDEDSDPAEVQNDLPDDDDGFFGDPDRHYDHEQADDAFDDVPLSPDESLTIESMLKATGFSASSPPPSTLPYSPPAFSPLSPTQSATSSPRTRKDTLQFVEEEERDDSYEGQIDLNSIESILQSSFSKRSESTPPATPPSRTAISTSLHPTTSTESKIPLRKSTHAERLRATPKPIDTESGIEHAVGMLPPSPSPIKPRNRTVTNPIPREPVTEDLFTLEHQILHSRTLPQIKDEVPIDLSFLSHSNDSIDARDISIGHSEISIDVPPESKDSGVRIHPITDLVAPSEGDTSVSSCESRDFVAGDVEAKNPTTSHPPAASPSNGSSESLTGRPRISKLDMQRRLLEKRRVDGGDSGDDSTAAEEKDRKSDSTSLLTDGSLENAVVETAERHTISLAHNKPITTGPSLSLPGPSLDFDFGSRFGRGLGVELGNFGSSGASEMGMRNDLSEPMSTPALDMDVDMRSALDRLVDDVAGGVDGRHRRRTLPETPDESMTASFAEDSMATEECAGATLKPCAKPASVPLERAATDSIIVPGQTGAPAQSSMPSRSASVSSIPPPPPPKDAIRAREELILEKRRQVRQQEDDESQGYYTPPKVGLGARRAPAHLLAIGRPSRRRSMSTGDLELLNDTARKREEALLDVATFTAEEDPLADSIDRELRKLRRNVTKKIKYSVRQHEGLIYASSDADKVSHMDSAGDVDSGRAWRAVRRPSDMNEYSKQIKEYRAQEKPGKTHGKVFVKGIKNLNVPLPPNPTWLTCTLNNGIHFVTTPEVLLGPDCCVEQEFELIEHSKLEFTLTLKIRRDPHIIAQFKALSHSPTPGPTPSAPAPSRGGMRNFFMSSPKKKDKTPVQPTIPLSTPRILPENLARYLKPDGTLARCFISFKDIAGRCDTRLFETGCPLIGQKTEAGNTMSTLQVGEIVLQVFRLPPLPGIPADQLPQSLEECLRGLRHVNWHKVTYFEGTLTQNGGDCTSWRRRRLRVIGAKLIAFNDVTRKATATIDLRKAIAVEDDQEMRDNLLSPDSQKTARNHFVDEYDGLYGVERSFRLVFPHDQEILFFADTDEEKSKWLEVLRALVGHIPPHPLWAELLWERQNELGNKIHSQRTSKPTQ